MSDSTNSNSHEESIDPSIRHLGGFLGPEIWLCKVCNKPFPKGKKRLGVCSEKCRQKYGYRKKNGRPVENIKTATCIVCGGGFKPSRPNKLMCSDQCLWRGKKRREAGQPIADQIHKKQCPVCYVYFTSTRWDKKYCTKKCVTVGGLRRMRGVAEGNILSATCCYCGKTYRPHYILCKYCSIDCYKNAQKLHQAGIELPYPDKKYRHGDKTRG